MLIVRSPPNNVRHPMNPPHDNRSLEERAQRYTQTYTQQDMAQLLTTFSDMDELFDTLIFKKEQRSARDITLARENAATLLGALVGANYTALLPLEPARPPLIPDIDAHDFSNKIDRIKTETLHDTRQEATFRTQLPRNNHALTLYSQPILYGDMPVGVVILGFENTGKTISKVTQAFIDDFLEQLDTRLVMAYELIPPEAPAVPQTTTPSGLQPLILGVPKRVHDTAQNLNHHRPNSLLFGTRLPGSAYAKFLENYQLILNGVATALDATKHYYLYAPVTSEDFTGKCETRFEGYDLKDPEAPRKPRLAHAYHMFRHLYNLVMRLPALPQYLAALEPPDLETCDVNFMLLTHRAAARFETAMGPALYALAGEMNDVSELLEMKAGRKIENPFFFHAANIGEILAQIALAETVGWNNRLKQQMYAYPLARQFLFGTEEYTIIPPDSPALATIHSSQLALNLRNARQRIPGFTTYARLMLQDAQQGVSTARQ